MKTIPTTKLAISHLTADEEALLRCAAALERKDQGDSDGAQKVMRPLWRMGERPETDGLDPSVAAEVLLTTGILTGWVGSQSEIDDAQEAAKNLITESITYHESVGDAQKAAAARAEIAYCYWREGELSEARIMLLEALEELTIEGDTRAKALLKLVTVERSASRIEVALEILQDNASLFRKITKDTIKGSYHNELAIVLRRLAHSQPGKKQDYLQLALREYESADQHFGLAKNNVLVATVKNNVGLVLFNLSRFKEAHKYLLEAQRLALSVKDKVRAALSGETRAQVLIAENNFTEADAVVRQSIQVLEKSGQQGALGEALITHGIALARLKQAERAQFTFERAIDVATQVGAHNQAGLAALTAMEELDHLSRGNLQTYFQVANEGLAQSLNHELIGRLNAAASKVYVALNRELESEDPTEAIGTPCNFQEEVLKFEGTLIRRALAQANGSVTRAAALLSLSYQALAYIIGGRHKDLLKERTPVRRRRSNRKEMQSRQTHL